MPPPGGLGGGSVYALTVCFFCQKDRHKRDRDRETVIEGKKVIGLEMEQQGQRNRDRDRNRGTGTGPSRQGHGQQEGTEGQKQKE